MSKPCNVCKEIIADIDLAYINPEQIKGIIGFFRPYVNFFKIGLNIISSGKAIEIINFIHDFDGKVFYSGKFSDSPEVVAKSTEAIAHLDIYSLDVHVASGLKSLEKAVQNRDSTDIMIVSTITSVWDEGYNSIFKNQAVGRATHKARLAKLAGCQGVVCSPEELKILNSYPQFKDMDLVVDNVKPIPYIESEQEIDPASAIALGVDYVIIDVNLILKAPHPTDMIKSIVSEIEMAKFKRSKA